MKFGSLYADNKGYFVIPLAYAGGYYHEESILTYDSEYAKFNSAIRIYPSAWFFDAKNSPLHLISD